MHATRAFQRNCMGRKIRSSTSRAESSMHHPTSAAVLPNDWCQPRSQCSPNVCPCFAASVSKTPRGAQGCAQAQSVANVTL